MQINFGEKLFCRDDRYAVRDVTLSYGSPIYRFVTGTIACKDSPSGTCEVRWDSNGEASFKNNSRVSAFDVRNEPWPRARINAKTWIYLLANDSVATSPTDPGPLSKTIRGKLQINATLYPNQDDTVNADVVLGRDLGLASDADVDAENLYNVLHQIKEESRDVGCVAGNSSILALAQQALVLLTDIRQQTRKPVWPGGPGI